MTNESVVKNATPGNVQSGQIKTVLVSEVVFNKDFYTRTESQSPAKVQEYATSIAGGEFPPILLNQENILLDGWHRWMAHKECGLETIDVEYLDTSGFVFDGKLDIYAIKRKAARSNFRHGQPQTEKELKKLIRDEYRAKLESLDQKGRAELKKDMAKDYSRSERYIREATSRIDKDLKVELREMAFNLWMGCYSQQEIADAVGYSEKAVREFLDLLRNGENGTDAENPVSSENPELTNDSENREFDEDEQDDSNSLGVYKLDKRLLIKANHMDDKFTPPIYNIWKQQERSEQVNHFGNSEISFVDNLLYLYTKPFDVVVDPFGGGGSTIDLCKTRLRRYLVSDRKPIEIRSDIRQHDINERRRHDASDVRQMQDHIMLIEVKSFCRKVPFAQRDTLNVIDGILRKATVVNNKRRSVQIPDTRCPGANRYVRWLGVHILELDHDRPDNSSLIIWDHKAQLSEQRLIEILRFDYDADYPNKIMDTRRHHIVNPKAVTGSLNLDSAV